MKLSPTDRRFCSLPWLYAEIYAGGGVYVCCPAWNGNKHIGNIYTESAEEIWNSAQALEFRRGILDGTFSQCDRTHCYHLVSGGLPTPEQARLEWNGEELGRIIDQQVTVLHKGPTVVKLGYDSSCNLRCPSCRSELLMAKGEEQKRLDRILEEFIVPFLKHAQVLILSSDGDPFASHHYRQIMRKTAAELPELKLGLCTNGVLLDERAWVDFELEGRVTNVQVSIDAAHAGTYVKVRTGGDFERLMRNLEFLARKRRAQKLVSLDLLFVVQSANFREMPDFVELGARLGADTVQFMAIDHWDRGMSLREYGQSKIWDKSHPDYAEFRALLEDPRLTNPIVRLNSLTAIVRDEQLGETHVDFATGAIHQD